VCDIERNVGAVIGNARDGKEGELVRRALAKEADLISDINQP
jgi:hypothetical protein